MKILMIAPEPFFEARGTPFSVLGRLRALSHLGHEVDLLTYHVGENVVLPGVSISRTPFIPFIKDVSIGPSWKKLFLDMLLFAMTCPQLLCHWGRSPVTTLCFAILLVVPSAYYLTGIFDPHRLRLLLEVLLTNFSSAALTAAQVEYHEAKQRLQRRSEKSAVGDI